MRATVQLHVLTINSIYKTNNNDSTAQSHTYITTNGMAIPLKKADDITNDTTDNTNADADTSHNKSNHNNNNDAHDARARARRRD